MICRHGFDDAGRMPPCGNCITEAQNMRDLAPASGRIDPAPEHILQFFANAHLPPPLQAISEPFRLLAEKIVSTLPRNPERTVALRKLLEAKDAAVRAAIATEVPS